MWKSRSITSFALTKLRLRDPLTRVGGHFAHVLRSEPGQPDGRLDDRLHLPQDLAGVLDLLGFSQSHAPWCRCS